MDSLKYTRISQRQKSVMITDPHDSIAMHDNINVTINSSTATATIATATTATATAEGAEPFPWIFLNRQHLGPFWDHFGTILGQCRVHFSIQCH